MGKNLAIDFDGVIHDYKNPLEGGRMGAPIEGARDSLRELKAQGHKIIIFTVWGDERGSKIVEEWLNHWDIPFHQITNIKLRCDFYVDDNALRFENNWPETLQEICKKK